MTVFAQRVLDDLSTIEGVISKTRSGIPRRKVDEVASQAALSDKEMARILNMSIRSLHAKRPDELLAADAAERLLLLEHIVQRGLHVFDGRKNQLAAWLRTPLSELALSPEVTEPRIQSKPTPQMGRFDEPFDLLERVNEDRARSSQLPVPIPQTPLEVLDTISGFRLVENVLGRIETGVFS